MLYLPSRLSDNAPMIASFPSRATPSLCVFLLLAMLGMAPGTMANPDDLVVQGQRAFQSGAFSQAAAHWQNALASYRRQGNTNAEIQTSLLVASACQSIGQQRHAVEILQTALARAEKHGDGPQVNVVKSKLGAALIMTLETERAASLLGEALAAATAGKDSRLAASILNDLGNLSATGQRFAEALTAYGESIRLARQTSNTLLTAQALCNSAATAARAGEFAKADDLNAEALREIDGLDISYAKAFLLLTSGQTDRQLKLNGAEPSRRLLLRANQSFQQALEIAGKIQSRSIETYALGYLGQLYEQDKQLEAALTLTRRAAFAAQQAQMPEAMYRWEWQAGRLLKARGETEPATAAYRLAVQTLQPIRNDVSIGYGNATARPSFRESEGPLFFELADLLLQQAKAATDPKREQQLLREARDTVEHLKAVELEDYFCDECVDVSATSALTSSGSRRGRWRMWTSIPRSFI
jgi:tetratricopeptide (TPR) repeat protein